MCTFVQKRKVHKIRVYSYRLQLYIFMIFHNFQGVWYLRDRGKLQINPAAKFKAKAAHTEKYTCVSA